MNNQEAKELMLKKLSRLIGERSTLCEIWSMIDALVEGSHDGEPIVLLVPATKEEKAR